MKFKVILFLLFILISFHTKADTKITPIHIKWTGTDTWYAKEVPKSVIAFEGASYPENDLPYYVNRINRERNRQYSVSIENAEYIPMVDSKELALVQGVTFSDEPELTTHKRSERGNEYLGIQLLPFVKRAGKVLKLKSFDLKIEQTLVASKAPRANNTMHTYAETSVLANGKFVKVKVSESGVYKLTYETLNEMGINPANVRVFGYGGAQLDELFSNPKKDDLPEVAVYMNKGADGVFNAGDYILFYAQGVNSWRYDQNKRIFVHTLNTYSTAGYYFITSDAGVGKTMESYATTVPDGIGVVPITEFTDYQVYEKELSSLINSGRIFYGEVFSEVLTRDFPFSFPNIVKTPSTKVRIDVASASTTTSSFAVKMDNKQEQNIYIGSVADRYEFAKPANNYYTYTPMSDNLIVNLSYNKGNTTSKGYLNYIEVNARRKLQMTGSVMFFRSVDNLYNTSIYNKYQISDANENIEIWNITDPCDVKKVATTYSNGTIEFIDGNEALKQYVAVDPTAGSAFAQPEIGGVLPNQNIHGMPSAEFLIITHPRFVKQANDLAAAHRAKDNMTVNVVTTEQVYNEFSSGTPDATAYRWVTKMFYDRALAAGDTKNMPKYLLLFGRGTYDNRKLLNSSSENLILTFQSENSYHFVNSIVTDDYFGLLDDTESKDVKGDLMDVGVGRFTVLTEQQATDVVNKTIGYMENSKKGIWKNQLCFVGDDGGDNNGNIHMLQADSVAKSIYQNNKGFQLNKIYLDAYKQEIGASGESYPQAKAKLNSLIHSGVFILNFTGHAGSSGWTNEQVLTTADVKQLYNAELGFWTAATCDFVDMDKKEISAGEYVLLNPTGGGVGILAAARTVYSSNNFLFNRAFNVSLFNKKDGRYGRLGDAMRNGKNALVGKDKESADPNKLSYVLLANPALHLTYPTDYKVITEKINGNAKINGADTIKALSIDSIQGYITDLNDDIVSDYNGTLEVTIYDKLQRITTFNNHNETKGFFNFDDYPNVIYSGKCNVKDGKFSFTFMTPKDIRYNYGNGRINYYASEPNSSREAQGYFENFVVGGASSNYDMTDNAGPNIDIYLNRPDFQSGGKVNETPVFFANISDKNGINTSGSGIGHDLRLTLDDNPFSSFSLNEYFTAVPNSYTAGFIQYKLPKLPEGKHTLTFQAWDLLNNSSSATLDFEVVNGLQPSIAKVYCYPNPAATSVKFVVEHDRPSTVLETTVDVYDLVGRRIWSKSQSSTKNLTWDLVDSFGKRAQQGIYLYKVSIKTQNSVETTKANKLIISSVQ